MGRAGYRASTRDTSSSLLNAVPTQVASITAESNFERSGESHYYIELGVSLSRLKVHLYQAIYLLK